MVELDFRGLVEAATDVVAVLDREHRYLYVNGALERTTGVPRAALLGKRNEDVMPQDAAVLWREALDDVFDTGRERTLECTLDTKSGPRRFAALLTKLDSERVCSVSRDVTEVDSGRLLATAALTMPTAIEIVDAPSGRVSFRNARAEQLFGAQPPSAASTRALRGETIAGEQLVIAQAGALRTLSVNASPVRDRDGAIIASVSTYDDITEAKRAHEAASYLAAAGKILERFDPDSSLQAIVDLAVPVLADWCFILLAIDGPARVVAIAHAEPQALAAARARSPDENVPRSSTAIARVLAGGPCELVDIDDATLEHAAHNAEHFAVMKARGHRSAVVAPLPGRDRVLGAVTFTMASSGRRYQQADLDMLAELARRTGIALDNSRLLNAERTARHLAEEASDRTRRMSNLIEKLSIALDKSDVAKVMVAAGRDALGAAAGFAWLLRDEQTLDLAAWEYRGSRERLESFRIIPMSARLPVCDVVRSASPMMFENVAAMAANYPAAVTPSSTPMRAWMVMPVIVSGRTIGAVSFAFESERQFSTESRELLAALIAQASIALERAQLYETLRTREEQLRAALSAAHAGTWRLDLKTMTSTRDPSYRALVGGGTEEVTADFAPIHPDDREVARRAFERTLREGVPYEPEVRVQRADGSYFWLRGHARVLYDAEGKPAELAGVAVDIDEAKRASLRAEEERRVTDTLHRLGRSFASELDRARLVQLITDEIAKLIGAEAAAFFAPSEGADPLALAIAYQASSIALDPELFAPLIARACAERRVLRDGDLPGPVRSYLAIPVIARSGDVFGGLVFGSPGRFTADHERLAASIASHATVALENAHLYGTVREQKEQLELAVERVRLADRRKDEFLAMLGHELRNPLAPIATALALMDLKSENTLQRERDVIRRQVHHLTRLVDDLLDVSRITRGKVQLAQELVELSDVLAKAIEMASPLLEKRLQQLRLAVPRHGLLVNADPTRLAQVFQNLLTNAAKYSDARAEIELRARAVDAQVVVEVSDRGIGIHPELIPRLFDLFAQGERAIDRAEGGLGIGLTIARSLCELHGGTIEAESRGPGLGSTFRVVLPLARRSASDASLLEQSPQTAARNGQRVLIVDDNVDAALTLQELVIALGHDARVAHDGVVALQLAGVFQPQIALLDIGLPVMDGYELARRLRETIGPDALRLIAVTGYGQDTDRARSRDAGFDHHLVKPIALSVLTPLLQLH